VKRAVAVLSAAVTLAAVGTTAQASTTVGGNVVGSAGYYDYSPTVIQSQAAQTQDFWWCGDSSAHHNDTIMHQQYSFAGGVHVTVPEHGVLDETAGSWDSVYTCNPDVVEGTFVNPLGNGITYTYAMYYVGTNTGGGTDNSIGVAFGTGPDYWVKYPQPVIPTTSSGGTLYGVGRPNVSYVNGTLTMLYENTDATGVTHLESTSTDGVHWTPGTVLSAAGLPSPQPSWGGAAYDLADGRWYAAVNNDPTRSGERGQPGVSLYSTPDPTAGPWTRLDGVDTAITGRESNFIAGLNRQADGTLYGPQLPSVELYLSASNPRPAYNASASQLTASGAFNNWDVSWVLWTPGNQLRKLTRVVHYSTAQHETTTGWYDSSYYTPETFNLGSLYETPAGDANVPLYTCKAFTTDYIPTTDPNCMGQYKSGILGYLYAAPATGRIAIYRCTVSQVGDFVSTDPGCEGQIIDGLLGYSQS